MAFRHLQLIRVEKCDKREHDPFEMRAITATHQTLQFGQFGGLTLRHLSIIDDTFQTSIFATHRLNPPLLACLNPILRCAEADRLNLNGGLLIDSGHSEADRRPSGNGRTAPVAVRSSRPCHCSRNGQPLHMASLTKPAALEKGQAVSGAIGAVYIRIGRYCRRKSKLSRQQRIACSRQNIR